MLQFLTDVRSTVLAEQDWFVLFLCALIGLISAGWFLRFGFSRIAIVPIGVTTAAALFIRPELVTGLFAWGASLLH